MSDLPDEAIDRLASAAARMLSEIGFELDDVDCGMTVDRDS